MNQLIRPTIESRPSSKWRLWVDRCGGFELLTGNRWSVGGSRPDESAEIAVRCDWRRFEGMLVRRDGDYFFVASGESEGGRLLGASGIVPMDGAARLRLCKPSPLSASAVLSLDPPHRFDNHVDQILLVDQTILVGSEASNHIRCQSSESSAVLVCRNGMWQAKMKSPATAAAVSGHALRSQFVELVPGQRISLGDVDMMLEAV